MLTAVGGGGKSSIGTVSSGGVGGVLSNSAMGAIVSGMGDTEFESIYRLNLNFMLFLYCVYILKLQISVLSLNVLII